MKPCFEGRREVGGLSSVGLLLFAFGVLFCFVLF